MLNSYSPTLLAATAALFVVSFFGIITAGFLTLAQPRITVNRRLARLGLSDRNVDRPVRQALTSRQKRIQDRVQSLETRKKREGPVTKIRSKMLQAGLESNIRSYFAGAFLLGLASFTCAHLFSMPWFVAISAGIVTAYFVPGWILSNLYQRRQKKFTTEFANALDVIIRGVRSGLPISECLDIIGREIPDPVGEEFRRLVEGQKIGLTLPTLLQRGLERMPTKEFKFFAIILQIQQETGGNLADTLENLSTVLRQRKQMRDKANALSSEAKSSAAIIGSLPFLVMAGISAVNGEYMSVLFGTKAGQITMACGLCWMALGILVMRNMINFKM